LVNFNGRRTDGGRCRHLSKEWKLVVAACTHSDCLPIFSNFNPMLSPSFTPFPVLRTSRLLLRYLTPADAPGVWRLRSDTEVMKYINRPLTQTVEEAEKWIAIVGEALEKNDGITWCICLKDQPSEHRGTVGFWRIDKENHRAEIGYMLDPSLHRQGIMYEAVMEAVKYGFQHMRLHSIEAQIDPRNEASAAVLRKAGFEQEAYFKENYYLQGGFADTAVFSLLTPLRQNQHAETPAEERVSP
jgi:ribosomal-protein-alanine N-acetyltransferase